MKATPERSVPFPEFKSSMEHLQGLIGHSPSMGDTTRYMLLGWIDELMCRFGAREISTQYAAARDLLDATHRAAAISKRMDLSVEDRKDRIREIMMPYIRKGAAQGEVKP